MSTELRETLDSEILLAGFDHWSSLAAGALIPRRDDLDPSKLPPELLPHIVMLEVCTEPLNFRYRVLGDHVLRYLTYNLTDTWMSDTAHQGASSKLFRTLAKVVKSRKPLLSEIPFADPEKDYLTNAEIILPLCGDDGEITRLLIFVDCVSIDATADELVD